LHLLHELDNFLFVCVSTLGFKTIEGLFELLLVDVSEGKMKGQLGQWPVLFFYRISFIFDSVRYISKTRAKVLPLPEAYSARNLVVILLAREDAYIACWDVLLEKHIIEDNFRVIENRLKCGKLLRLIVFTHSPD